MNEKKYILTKETKIVGGHMLHRIQAIRDFGDVKAGDLGGWIEKEENLSHNGFCWVYDEACVFEGAWVFGDAWVNGNVRVFGDTRIFGDARVYGNVRVFGDANLYGNAQISENTQVYGMTEIGSFAKIESENDFLVIGPIGSRDGYTTFYKTTEGTIWVSCGCFNGSIDDFKEKVERVHKSTKHEKDYMGAIEFAKRKLYS